MRKVTLLILLLCPWQTQAQVAWQKNYKVSDPAGFTVLENAATMLQTADGGYLVGGTYTQANEARLGYLMKIDANGDSLWTKLYTYTDRLAKLYVDNNNDLRGIFEQSASGQGTSLYFTKLDPSNGDTISSFQAPKPVGPDVYRYTSHVQLPDNSYLLTALGNGQGGHFLRFTPGAATATWYADSMANKVMSFTDMILDGQDAVVTGWSAVPGGPALNFLVAKYDIVTGKPVWRKIMLYLGGCCDTRGRCIVKNGQGNYIAGGEWREKVSNIIVFSPAFFVIGPNGDSLSTTEPHLVGNVQKMMKWGNYILATGQIENDDLAPNNTNLHHTDIGLYVMQDDGHLLNTSLRFNNAVALQTSSGYVTSHWSSGGLMGNAANEVIIYGQGAHLPGGNTSPDQNTFIVKLTPGTAGIADVSGADGVEFYPNPMTNRLYVSTAGRAGIVQISNIFGQTMYREHITRKATIDTDTWPAGMYLIHFNDGGSIRSSKVIKQ